MSSSEGLVSPGSALPGQPVEGLLKDLRAMTSAKRPATSRSDSSPDRDTRERKVKGKGFWANDVEPMTDDDSSDDGFKTVPPQSMKDKKKKKKLKAQTSLRTLKVR